MMPLVPNRFLTKSRFKTAIECPRKLYYTGKNDVYRNLKGEDALMQALADGGFQVGELAKCLYPEGIEVVAKGNAEALAETTEQLKSHAVTLFEPAISYGRFLVRVDILIKQGNQIKLVEVKAKSIDSQNLELTGKTGRTLKPAYRPYIEDIAFQKYVVSLAFPNCQVSSFLMMPDKSRVAMLDRMNQLFKIKRIGKQSSVQVDPRAQSISAAQSLLHEFPVDDYVAIVHEQGITFPGGTGSMEEMALRWAEAYAEDQPLAPAIGAHCAKCEFKAKPGDGMRSGFAECWKEANGWTDGELEQPTVLDLWNFRGKQKLLDQNKRLLVDVDDDDLAVVDDTLGLSNSKRQWLQVQWESNPDRVPLEYKSAGYFLDRTYMVQEMQSWRYPLHFIDFETAAVALPFHVGMRPFESVAFQFSHHTLEQDGTLRHAGEFLLAEAGQFPNYEFARALRADLSGDDGSVFMWANHENTILTHIIEQLKNRDDAPDDRDDLIAFLQMLVKGGQRAMIDLRTVAQKGYFHPSTKGSNSIKKVLPAVLGSSDYLRERYSQPIYGAANGILSLNFRDMVWWTQDDLGLVEDPYKKLKNSDVTGQLTDVMDDDDLDIIGGGEASMAYGRLQFETLNEDTRSALKAKLLRYCELDTLAMAMIVEAWKSEIR